MNGFRRSTSYHLVRVFAALHFPRVTIVTCKSVIIRLKAGEKRTMADEKLKEKLTADSKRFEELQRGEDRC